MREIVSGRAGWQPDRFVRLARRVALCGVVLTLGACSHGKPATAEGRNCSAAVRIISSAMPE